jgi:hypothetical protein
MIEFPPYFLLLAYGLFLVGYLFFAIVNIVLLARYGARNAIGFLACFGFICGTAFILMLTFQAVEGIDRMSPVPLFTIPVLNT